MSDRGGACKSYIIYAILAILVHKHGWREENYLNLSTYGKSAFLIREYTVYGNKFDVIITTVNSKFKKVSDSLSKKNKQKILKSLKTTLFDKHSMLR